MSNPIMDRSNRLIWWITLAAFVISGVILTVGAALRSGHAGHADTSFYYGLAENLAAGKGYEIDYVWHYLAETPPIPAPATNYWHPGASIIMGAAMYLFQPDIRVALTLTILYSVAIVFVTYLLGLELSDSRFVGVLSGILVFIMPISQAHAMRTDTSVFSGLYFTTAILFATRGFEKPRYFLWAGLVAGAGYIVRPDAVILIIMLVLCVLFSRQLLRDKFTQLALVCILFAVAASPLFIINWIYLGQISNPSSSYFLFVERFLDIFRLEPYTFADASTRPLQDHLIPRLESTWQFIWRYLIWLGLLLPMTFVGAFSMHRQGRLRQTIPTVLVFLGMLGLIGFLIPYLGEGGTTFHSALNIVPALVVLSLIGMQSVLPRLLFFGGYIGVGLYFFALSLISVPNLVSEHNATGETVMALGEFVEQNFATEDVSAIMTNIPWEFTTTTDIPSVMIPSDSLEAVIRVSEIYDANILLIDPKSGLVDQRVFVEIEESSRFRLVGEVAGYVIWQRTDIDENG